MLEQLLLLSQVISALTLATDIALVVFLGLWAWHSWVTRLSFFDDFKNYLRDVALPVSFLMAFGGIVGSLFYSNVLGYEPCELCWWARVFLYPQAFILALAWPRKNRQIFSYLLPLSFLGAAVMIYNQALQMGWIGASSIFCGSGEGVDCTLRYVFDYGFITIPMMALTTFGWLIILGILGKEEKVASK